MKTLNLSKEQMEQLNDLLEYTYNCGFLGFDSKESAWNYYFKDMVYFGNVLYKYIDNQDEEYSEISEIVELADNELLIVWGNNAVVLDKNEHFSFINNLIEELEGKEELCSSIDNQLKKINKLVEEYGITVKADNNFIFKFYEGNNTINYTCKSLQDFNLNDFLKKAGIEINEYIDKDYWIVECNETSKLINKDYSGKIVTKELLDELKKIDQNIKEYNQNYGHDEFGQITDKFDGYTKFHFEHIVNGEHKEHLRIDIGDGNEVNKNEFRYLYEQVKVNQKRKEKNIMNTEKLNTYINSAKEAQTLEDTLQNNNVFNIVGNVVYEPKLYEGITKNGDKFKVADFTVVSKDEEGNKIYHKCSAFNDKADKLLDFKKGDFVNLFGKEKPFVNSEGKEGKQFIVLSSKMLLTIKQQQQKRNNKLEQNVEKPKESIEDRISAIAKEKSMNKVEQITNKHKSNQVSL